MINTVNQIRSVNMEITNVVEISAPKVMVPPRK